LQYAWDAWEHERKKVKTNVSFFSTMGKKITNFWPIGVKEMMSKIRKWALKNQSR